MGPFKIEEIVGESKLAYHLQLPPQMRVHPVFHVSDLKLYISSSRKQYSRPDPEIIEDHEEYEVEKVLDHKYDKRRRCDVYLIKWKGYPESEST